MVKSQVQVFCRDTNYFEACDAKTNQMHKILRGQDKMGNHFLKKLTSDIKIVLLQDQFSGIQSTNKKINLIYII